MAGERHCGCVLARAVLAREGPVVGVLDPLVVLQRGVVDEPFLLTDVTLELLPEEHRQYKIQ